MLNKMQHKQKAYVFRFVDKMITYGTNKFLTRICTMFGSPAACFHIIFFVSNLHKQKVSILFLWVCVSPRA